MSPKNMLITPNKYSRPELTLETVRAIVIHWFASPKATAENVAKFFEKRKYGKSGYGSAHYNIGLEGENVQTLPENEIGYHVGSKTYTAKALRELSSYPNNCTIGVEHAHVDWDGKMTDDTYWASVEFVAELCKRHNLDENDLWLHQEVVGWKDCHRWFVNHKEDWKQYKRDVAKAIHGEDKDVADKELGDLILVEPDGFGYYEVKSGDTIWGLSQALDVSMERIKELNPKVNPKKLKVGQKLKIVEVKIKKHKIVKGDNLWKLARKYETTVAKLKDLNEGLEAKALQVGSEIAVPVDGENPTPDKDEKRNEERQEVREAVIKSDVYAHSKPDFEVHTRTGILTGGTEVHVYGENGQLYSIGNGRYVSKNYIKFESHDKPSFPLPSGVLEKGDRGSKVKMLQRALNEANFKVGKVDGVYGGKTENAVRRFQSMYKELQVDGVYGGNTRKILGKKIN